MAPFDYTLLCRHVDKETALTELTVTGSIPKWVDGFLIYNGPGVTKVGDSEYKHCFDSGAILQRFNIKDGKVSYFNKFLESETYKRNKKDGRISVAEFGTPGPGEKSKISRLLDSFDMDKLMSDNAVLSCVKLGKRFFAVGETPYYLEIDPETFKVVKRFSLNKLLSLTTQGVHLIEADDGTYYSMNQTVGVTGPKYSLVQFPADGNIEKAKSVATFPCRWRLSPCYVHSVAMTPNYLILVETPLSVSIMDLLGDIINNRPFIEGLKWQDAKAIFHVIDRKTWKPVASKYQYVANPFFFMHFASAYEEDNHIVLELATYKDHTMMGRMFIKNLRDTELTMSDEFGTSFRSRLHRYVLPLNIPKTDEGIELVKLKNTNCSAKRTGNEIVLEPESLSDLNFEGPTSNKKNSKTGKNKYIYGLGMSEASSNYVSIVKVDVDTKESKVFMEDSLHCSFPSFVPSNGATKEDDGVLVAMGLKSNDPTYICLLVIDAKTMEETGRASFNAQSQVSNPLHGSFFTS